MPTYRHLVTAKDKPGAEARAVLQDLLSIGQLKDFPKWGQWEEVVAGKELLKNIRYTSSYRTLMPEEIIEDGDEVEAWAEGSTIWRRSVAVGRVVESQIYGLLRSYRRPTRCSPPKISKAIEAKLIEAIESILYMGADEKYNDWERLGEVIIARKLIAKQKTRK